jgi:hypothetical protein
VPDALSHFQAQRTSAIDPPVNEKNENPEAITPVNAHLLAVTQTAVGCGLGLLLAGKLSRTAQKNTAFVLLGVGALLAVPAVIEAIGDIVSGPRSERGVRQRLDSIRGDSGMDDTELV